MNIKIDPEKCIGCGSCAALAQKTFKLNDDYKAEVIDGDWDDEETIKMAVESCPTEAIIIE